MNILIEQNELVIDSQKIKTKQDFPILINALGNVERKIIIDNETNLHIYDKLGIRFWEKSGKLQEFQIQLNKTNNSEFSPKDLFKGKIIIYNKINITKETFEVNSDTIESLQLTKNLDHIQYGITILEKNSDFSRLGIRVMANYRIAYISYNLLTEPQKTSSAKNNNITPNKWSFFDGLEEQF